MLKAHSLHILDLFYPSVCVGCSNTLLSGEDLLCLECLFDMPFTRMHDLAYNTVEMRLYGRFEFTAATSLLFFMKNGKVQRMLHELKYLGGKEVGIYLGKQLAEALQASERFLGLEYVVPVPLHPRRQKERGYNQSEIIAEGMEEKGFHIVPHALERLHNNASQTRKNMTERYKNVQQVFACARTDMLRGKKVLLLDDILTTGATLEACAKELLKVDGIELFVATIACAEH